MAKYLVTAKIEVETISGPFPAEYQIQHRITDLIFDPDNIICLVSVPGNKKEISQSRVIAVNVKAERI
jgi:hypothetical protein